MKHRLRSISLGTGAGCDVNFEKKTRNQETTW